MTRKALDSNTQLLLIVNGTAGTGKSHTIAAISASMAHDEIVRAAFTAKAAYLIRGDTLHKKFKIPVEKGKSSKFGPLNGIRLAELQASFANIRLVIIDEYSMLSLPLLGKIDARLREAKRSNNPFGGISVILVGDPAQLPPVGAPALFNKISTIPFANAGRIAYSLFTKVIKLIEIQRQVVTAGDKTQKEFVETLNSLRGGKCSINQWQFLQKRNPANIPDFEEAFKDATYIFSTNEAANNRNDVQLQKLNMPITVLNAVNNPSNLKSRTSDEFRGLEQSLYLAVGSKIILISNISTAYGLTNGAKGKVVDIVYSKRPNLDLPDFIVVHFPQYTGPQLFQEASTPSHPYHNFLPIPSISVMSEDNRGIRTQFPIRLAYAMAIWKCQGETLDKVVADIGNREVAGLTFVAFSRVSNIRHLAIMPYDFIRAAKIAKGESLISRKVEESRLLALAVSTEKEWIVQHPEET